MLGTRKKYWFAAAYVIRNRDHVIRMDWNQYVNFWTNCIIFGLVISVIAWHYSGPWYKSRGTSLLINTHTQVQMHSRTLHQHGGHLGPPDKEATSLNSGWYYIIMNIFRLVVCTLFSERIILSWNNCFIVQLLWRILLLKFSIKVN